MKKSLHYFIILFAFLSGQAVAQDTIGIYAFGPHWVPDTVFAQSQDSISVFVQNKGANQINVPITLKIAILDSAILTIVDSVILTVTLNPMDTIRITILNHLFDTLPGGNYKLGGNTVVIWPSAVGVYTSDSLWDTIVVVIGVGVDEFAWQGYESLLLYPNPTNGDVFIHFDGRKKDIELVRITDVKGRLVKEYERTTKLNLRKLKPGVYFIEVHLNNKLKKTFKVMRK